MLSLVEVEDVVLTRDEFYQFCEEMKQIQEESQQDMHEIRQVIATFLTRKSSYKNTDQYIQRCAPNYKKISFINGEYFNFWKIFDDEKVWLTFSKLDNEENEWWEDIRIDKKCLR